MDGHYTFNDADLGVFSGISGKLASVGDEVAELKASVQAGVQDVGKRGRRVARAAGSAAQDAISTLRDSALDMRDQAGEKIAASPFRSVAIAAGAGAALTIMLMMWRKRS